MDLDTGAAPVTPAPISLADVMGPGFPAAAANLRRNLAEGRAGLAQTVLRRA